MTDTHQDQNLELRQHQAAGALPAPTESPTQTLRSAILLDTLAQTIYFQAREALHPTATTEADAKIDLSKFAVTEQQQILNIMGQLAERDLRGEFRTDVVYEPIQIALSVELFLAGAPIDPQLFAQAINFNNYGSHNRRTNILRENLRYALWVEQSTQKPEIEYNGKRPIVTVAAELRRSPKDFTQHAVGLTALQNHLVKASENSDLEQAKNAALIILGRGIGYEQHSNQYNAFMELLPADIAVPATIKLVQNATQSGLRFRSQDLDALKFKPEDLETLGQRIAQSAQPSNRHLSSDSLNTALELIDKAAAIRNQAGDTRASENARIVKQHILDAHLVASICSSHDYLHLLDKYKKFGIHQADDHTAVDEINKRVLRYALDKDPIIDPSKISPGTCLQLCKRAYPDPKLAPPAIVSELIQQFEGERIDAYLAIASLGRIASLGISAAQCESLAIALIVSGQRQAALDCLAECKKLMTPELLQIAGIQVIEEPKGVALLDEAAAAGASKINIARFIEHSAKSYMGSLLNPEKLLLALKYSEYLDLDSFQTPVSPSDLRTDLQGRPFITYRDRLGELVQAKLQEGEPRKIAYELDLSGIRIAAKILGVTPIQILTQALENSNGHDFQLDNIACAIHACAKKATEAAPDDGELAALHQLFIRYYAEFTVRRLSSPSHIVSAVAAHIESLKTENIDLPGDRLSAIDCRQRLHFAAIVANRLVIASEQWSGIDANETNVARLDEKHELSCTAQALVSTVEKLLQPIEQLPADQSYGAVQESDTLQFNADWAAIIRVAKICCERNSIVNKHTSHYTIGLNLLNKLGQDSIIKTIETGIIESLYEQFCSENRPQEALIELERLGPPDANAVRELAHMALRQADVRVANTLYLRAQLIEAGEDRPKMGTSAIEDPSYVPGVDSPLRACFGMAEIEQALNSVMASRNYIAVFRIEQSFHENRIVFSSEDGYFRLKFNAQIYLTLVEGLIARRQWYELTQLHDLRPDLGISQKIEIRYPQLPKGIDNHEAELLAKLVPQYQWQSETVEWIADTKPPLSSAHQIANLELMSTSQIFDTFFGIDETGEDFFPAYTAFHGRDVQADPLAKQVIEDREFLQAQIAAKDENAMRRLALMGASLGFKENPEMITIIESNRYLTAQGAHRLARPSLHIKDGQIPWGNQIKDMVPKLSNFLRYFGDDVAADALQIIEAAPPKKSYFGPPRSYLGQ